MKMENTTNEGCINLGLQANIMRHSIENKNLLQTKTSIYVGTGETSENVSKTLSLSANQVGSFFNSTGKDGELKISNFLNGENFNPDEIYTNLQNTWNNYQIQDKNFDPNVSYSNLKLTNNNFSSTDSYPAISFLTEAEDPIQIGNWGTLQLQNDSNSKLSLVTEPLGSGIFTHLYRRKVSIFITDLKMYFYYTFFSQKNNPIENLTTLRDALSFNIYGSGVVSYYLFHPTGGYMNPDASITGQEMKFRGSFSGVFGILTYSTGDIFLQHFGGYNNSTWTDNELDISYTDTKLV